MSSEGTITELSPFNPESTSLLASEVNELHPRDEYAARIIGQQILECFGNHRDFDPDSAVVLGEE